MNSDSHPDTAVLVASATDGQVRVFLQRILEKENTLIHDFEIFLHGPTETATTLKAYKEKIEHVLDQLDLDDLLQAWYGEGDDYYSYHSEYAPDVGPTLAEVIESFFDDATKYYENGNSVECLKQYQALFEALNEKQRTLVGDETELQDCFYEEIRKALDGYGRSLTVAVSSRTKETLQNNLTYHPDTTVCGAMV